MSPGERYTTVLRLPHRIDAVVVALHDDWIVADADHRCKPYCALLRDFASTLTLSGRRAFFYDQFTAQFVLVPEGAIALSGAA